MAEPEETIGLAEGQGSQSGGLPKPLRKRRRTVISCIECHRRKKKCDRLLPCSNCVERKKESICHYENEDARKQQLLEDGANALPGSGEAFSASRFDATEIASFGYVEGGGNDSTTLEIVKMIEGYSADQSVLATPTQRRVDKNGLWEKYKRLVGKLPPNEYVEKLVAIYFREVNYQYYPLDEDIFRDHLQQWYDLPLAVTNEQPLSLPSGLRFFPAVLFQMLALALLYQPPNYDRSFNCLKSTAGMSLDDLSGDYSESGSEISSLLGKRHTDLMAVQAGFLRTTYLKTCGFIPESWHSLSQTIRDAQEIGLHKGSRDCRGQGVETTIDTLDRLWVEQLQRRMWGILALWDIHMAIILGRPSTIDNTDKGAILPIDAPIPKNRRAIAPSPRTEDEPPTPLTALLWSIQLSAPLWDIYQLEKEGPSPLHISKVKKLHEDIIQVTHHCPPCLRSENPDTRFDSHPECYWLHYLRPNIQNETAFSLMALHRPYIFINTSSRTAALTAGLDILQAQRAFFDLIDVKDYKMSSLVIRTFDAIVVVAAIYILHPREHRSQLHAALQHFEWAMERFQLLSRRNSMAKAGLGVLKGIYVRLKKALSSENVLRRPPPSTQPLQLPTYPIPPDASHSSMPFSTPGSHTLLLRSSEENTTTSQTPGRDGFGPHITNDSVAKSNPASRTSPLALAWERFSENLQTLPDFDFSPIAPLQPMHDLVYNDLSIIADMQALDPHPGSQGPPDMAGMDTSGSWHFEGDFGTSSFWGFMNSYNS